MCADGAVDDARGRVSALARAIRAVAISVAALLALAPLPPQRLEVAEQYEIAPGARLHHATDNSLVDPPAPLSIWLLRLDAGRFRLRSALANDEILGTETVADIAARRGAIAAINAGFFAPDGDPSGLLAIGGRVVSDAPKPRGAVGIIPTSSGVRLLFGRVRASLTLVIDDSGDDPGDDSGRDRRDARGLRALTPIQGVDSVRVRGRLMLYTPEYHRHTDTAAGGQEWIVSGNPPRVVDVRTEGNTEIPRDGFVLSYRGVLPATLKRLRRGVRASVRTRYDSLDGAAGWEQAVDVVGGAGLLIRDSRDLDWAVEDFKPGFAENRHPRTMIGTERNGTIWLVTVDGRQPPLSAGMTLLELRALAHRLELTNALNLDGGGSTTMWVRGRIVNSPSDVTGPRKVSDALLVHSAAADPDKRSGVFPQ